jgi:hypothetical protein
MVKKVHQKKAVVVKGPYNGEQHTVLIFYIENYSNTRRITMSVSLFSFDKIILKNYMSLR